jgi:hypothetical protein
MPKFRVEYEREIVTVQTVTRLVDAETQGEAESKADQAASDYDSTCPDDAEDSGPGPCVGSWRTVRVSRAGGLDAGIPED